MPVNKKILWGSALAILIGVGAFSGVFQQFYLALLWATQDVQRSFHDTMAAQLRLFRDTHAFATACGLGAVGFLYGALHAVGPGHGKVLVSGYLLASPSSLRRGLAITFGAALMQACMAVLVVLGLSSLFGLTEGQARQTAASLESLSFGLVLLIGIALLARSALALRRVLRASERTPCHDGCHGCAAHAPNPADLEKAQGWGTSLALIVSIGVRPCSGALLLLLFAELLGVTAAGVGAVFAMSLGTALTTSLLAVLTVRSKAFALRWTEKSGKTIALFQAGLGLTGGVLIVLLGAAFLQSSLMGGFRMAPADGAAALATHPLMKSLPALKGVPHAKSPVAPFSCIFWGACEPPCKMFFVDGGLSFRGYRSTGQRLARL